jgi:hypothetical protein
VGGVKRLCCLALLAYWFTTLLEHVCHRLPCSTQSETSVPIEVIGMQADLYCSRVLCPDRYIEGTLRVSSHITTLMMGTEIVPETSVSTCNQVTQLCAQEDFFEFFNISFNTQFWITR